MKVLQITSILPNEKGSGGAEKLLYDLTNKLIIKGYQVEIVSASNHSNKSSIPIHTIFKVRNKILRKIFFDYYNPLNIIKIKNILVKCKPDIVHIHNVYGLSSQLVSYISNKYPTIITIHDHWPFCYWTTKISKNGKCSNNCDSCCFPFTFLHKRIHKKHLNKTYLVSPSNYMKQQLEQIGGYRLINTIHNGVNIPSQNTNYKPNILWVGRLTPEKGITSIIANLNYIKKHTNWNIIVLGEGPLKEKLKKNYPLIKFLGFQNPTNYYLNSSISVISSTRPENLPYSVLEAMSYGLVVIGSKIGGIPEIIKSNKTGFLYSSGDGKSLQKRILYLIKNPILIKKIGKNAQKDVIDRFNIDTTVKKYIKLYKLLIKKYEQNDSSKEAVEKIL